MAQSLSNLPIGALVKFGKYQVKDETPQDIVWQIAAKGHQSTPAYPTNSVTLFSKYILDLRAFDATETHLSSYSTQNVNDYGHNNYGESNIDQWLNSDANAGAWWKATHEGDRPPEAVYLLDSGIPYADRPGFLNAFSKDEKSALLDTTIRCVSGLSPAQGYGEVPAVDRYDIVRKVYLPSRTELGLATYDYDGSSIYGSGSDVRAYPSPQFCEYSSYTSKMPSGKYGDYWLRTADNVSNFGVYFKMGSSANGNTQAAASLSTIGVRPLVNVPSNLLVSDTTDSDGTYTIVWNNAPNVPTTLNVPTIYGGKGNTISWSASTDPDGDSVSYELECSVNGGTYTSIYSGTNLSYTHTVASGATTVQYRVRAVDSKGAGSAYTTSRSVTVTLNIPPVISGNDSNLGTLVDGVSVSYTVTDEVGDTVEVVEKIDGAVFRTYTATLGAENTCSINGTDWLKVLNGTHTLTIVATDSKGVSTTRTHTFTKNVTAMSIITDPMDSTTKPERVAFTVTRVIPLGAIFKVWVCNNGNDASPTWEEATNFADGSSTYTFTNATKTADKWAVCIKITVDRNGAIGDCYINGIGGNFE